MPDNSARHLQITGRVQGVGFRYALCAEAQRLALTGWVRNRRDGSVEAIVSGGDTALAQLLEWARRGPPGARVDHLHVELASGEFAGFILRPTE